MARKARILLTVGIGLLMSGSAVRAQDEQWLQYHCQREAHRTVGNMGTEIRRLTTLKPKGVELPRFRDEHQCFGLWPTPMVPSGYLDIALDRTKPQGRYDLLFIDSDADGHLSDEEPVTAYQIERYYTYFGPVKMVFDSDDGPIVYHLNFRLYDYNERSRRLYIYSGCWYEGDITVAGEKKRCVLIDQNVNGTFDDKAIYSNSCDRIRIGRKGARDASYVGNYIYVDEVLYSPEIARDGAYVILRKAENVRFGDVQLPETVTEFSAGGANGLFTLKPKNGIASLPVGKYMVNYWNIERKDDQGRRWTLTGTGSSYSAGSSFEINDAKQTELSVGEPIISSVQARTRGASYSFNQELRGKLGERISLTRNGARPQAPKLHIKSKDGAYNRTFSFEYG
ncbi:MAG: hypothetical protein ACYSWO_11595 [Planctomycetota bacterium]|jgi:hypothetical protein